MPIAFWEEPSEQPAGLAVRHGNIHSLDAAATAIRSIIEHLSDSVDGNLYIGRVYVGVGGRSLRTREVSIPYYMPDENGGEITQEILDEIEAEVRAKTFPGQSVLAIPQPGYIVNGRKEQYPKSLFCKQFLATYQVVTVRLRVKLNIEEVLHKQLNIPHVEILPEPLTRAAVVLSDNEKRLGAAHVNIGAGCTSVAVYKDDLLQHLRVVPMGGKNITTDLTNLRITEQQAEEVKIKHGSAKLDPTPGQMITVSSDDRLNEITIPLSDVRRYVQARMNEIEKNYRYVVEEAAGRGKLSRGIVLSGGAVRLNDFEQETQRKHTDVQFASLPGSILLKGGTEEDLTEDFLGCVGLAYRAHEECLLPAHGSDGRLFGDPQQPHPAPAAATTPAGPDAGRVAAAVAEDQSNDWFKRTEETHPVNTPDPAGQSTPHPTPQEDAPEADTTEQHTPERRDPSTRPTKEEGRPGLFRKWGNKLSGFAKGLTDAGDQIGTNIGTYDDDDEEYN